jgi:hypothetical protein
VSGRVAAVEVLQALCDPARLGLLARIAESGEAGCSPDAAARAPRRATCAGSSRA